MNANNTFYCSFVSIQYIICECGETFPSEDALKEHLERGTPHVKIEKKEEPDDNTIQEIFEFKCGECEEIFSTEEECLAHQEIPHVAFMGQEEDVAHTEVVPGDNYEPELDLDIKPILSPVEVISNSTTAETKPLILNKKALVPFTVSSRPVKVLSQPVALTKKSFMIGSQPFTIIDKEFLKDTPKISILDKSLLSDKQPATVTVQNKPVRVKKEKKERKPKEPKVQQKKIRTKAKNSVCEVCGKKYNSNAALRYHQRVHTGDRPYSCPFCPKNFTMPLFLQIHQRIHTGERPYACNLCPKAFTNKAALLRHDRVHTGAKPFECPKCGKCFSQSNSMKLHVHTVHLRLPTPYKSKKRRAEKLARDTKEKQLEEVDDQHVVKTEIDFPEINDESDIYYCDAETKNDIEYEIIYQQD